MNIKQIITVGIAGMAMGVMALDNVEVTDVKARQRYPWNGKVDIDFTLDSKPTEPYQMQVEVYDNVGKTNLPVMSVCTEGVSVEANPCMVRTDTRRIVWDAAKDLPNGFKCTNVLVTCRDARTLAVSNLYCVIDLQTGAKTYLDKIPVGGWTSEHKTTKMVFRRIEAGSFMMGSPTDEVGRQSNETQHKVTITRPYYIAVFEVTEAQYAMIMGTSSSSMVPKKLRWMEVRGHDYACFDAPWATSGFEGTVKTDYCWPEKMGVDQNSLVGKLRAISGVGNIDMPTEAQWEFAAKAETTTGLNDGHESSDEMLVNLARYEEDKNDQKGDTSLRAATIVGCYVPNAYGLYDMLGNLREWCLDAWSENLGSEPTPDPIGNLQCCIGNGASMRVVKGGGYFDRGTAVNNKITINDNAENATLIACRSAWRGVGYSIWDSSQKSSANYTSEGVRLAFTME